MKNTVLIICLLLSFGGFANTHTPASCKSILIQGEAIVLKGHKAQVILLHNLTDADLWLTHPVTQASKGSGWASRLQTKHWSSLTVNEFPFTITCIESRPGHEQQVPCEGAVTVCQWKKAKPQKNIEGSSWVAEDMKLDALLATIKSRGLIVAKVK